MISNHRLINSCVRLRLTYECVTHEAKKEKKMPFICSSESEQTLKETVLAKMTDQVIKRYVSTRPAYEYCIFIVDGENFQRSSPGPSSKKKKLLTSYARNDVNTKSLKMNVRKSSLIQIESNQ